jgi:sporulation protein YlmC with PRC-barrel domain
MLFSEARGRRVVGIETAEKIATVTACTIAPSPPRVTALRLKGSGLLAGRGRGDVLMWDGVQSFGTDAVTVRSADRIRTGKAAPAEEADPRRDPIGKPVLTEAGEALGTVKDIDFDRTDGRIHRLVTTGGDIPGERLVGAGGYAVVVTAGAGGTAGGPGAGGAPGTAAGEAGEQPQ